MVGVLGSKTSHARSSKVVPKSSLLLHLECCGSALVFEPSRKNDVGARFL